LIPIKARLRYRRFNPAANAWQASLAWGGAWQRFGIDRRKIMNETVTKLPVNTEKQLPATGWAPFESLRQEIDRLFDDFNPFGLRRPIANALKSTAWPVAPAVDLVEKDGQYEISAELPGMDEKNVEVKVANGVLTIRGEKTEEKREERKDYHLSERSYGSFQRSFRLPDNVDADKIEAHFSKGLLSVTLPKVAATAADEKKIDIKAA
jgi:HSP20 family protein